MLDLSTERLRLRWLNQADAPMYLQLLNEPSFLDGIGDKGVRDLAQARQHLRDGPIASYARHGHGMYAVERREDGTWIGICGLVRREGLDHPDLGYALLQQHHGLGYAAEAGAACLQLAHGTLALPTVAAITSLGNHGSMRVLSKLGFVDHGVRQLPGHLPPCRYFLHRAASPTDTEHHLSSMDVQTSR